MRSEPRWQTMTTPCCCNKHISHELSIIACILSSVSFHGPVLLYKMLLAFLFSHCVSSGWNLLNLALDITKQTKLKLQ